MVESWWKKYHSRLNGDGKCLGRILVDSYQASSFYKFLCVKYNFELAYL